MGVQAQRLLATLNTECASLDQLGQAVPEAFAQYPDHHIITSYTGLARRPHRARVLAEIVVSAGAGCVADDAGIETAVAGLRGTTERVGSRLWAPRSPWPNRLWRCSLRRGSGGRADAPDAGRGVGRRARPRPQEPLRFPHASNLAFDRVADPSAQEVLDRTSSTVGVLQPG